MTLRGIGSEHDDQRVRAAAAVLVLGVSIILATLGMAALRGDEPQPHNSQVAVQTPVPADDLAPARVGIILLMIFLVLVPGVAVAAYLLLRVAKKAALLEPQQPARPTPIDDIWQMHRPPAEEEVGDDDADTNG